MGNQKGRAEEKTSSELNENRFRLGSPLKFSGLALVLLLISLPLYCSASIAPPQYSFYQFANQTPVIITAPGQSPITHIMVRHGLSFVSTPILPTDANATYNFTIPYGTAIINGTALAAGSNMSYVVNESYIENTTYDKNGTASNIIMANATIIYNVSVSQVSSSPCITTNLESVVYCTNATTPDVIHVPIYNGKFALTGNNWYPLNITFSASLISGNTAPFNFTVHDITNNTNLVPLTTITANSVNVQKNFKIPINQQIEITFNSGGNSNYSKVQDDPITFPTNIENTSQST